MARLVGLFGWWVGKVKLGGRVGWVVQSGRWVGESVGSLVFHPSASNGFSVLEMID